MSREHFVDRHIGPNDEQVNFMLKELGENSLDNFLNKKYNITRKVMDDGHSSIFLGNLKIDFSSNFIVGNIDELLNNIGISNPTNMQREIFSRDFTCNSLLMCICTHLFVLHVQLV